MSKGNRFRVVYIQAETTNAIVEIKNHLGHVSLKPTMIYLEMDISRRRQIQEKYNINAISNNTEINPELDAIIDWKEKDKMLEWLDTL